MERRSFGRSGRNVPESSVRARFAETRVPTLLVVGEREERFAAHRRFAEGALPGLRVVALDAGHAVNAEAPPAGCPTTWSDGPDWTRLIK